MRVFSIPGPRRPLTAVEPAASASSRERESREHREPVVVNVPIPLRPSGAVSVVAEAYGQYAEARAVDVYL
jgi:hypothetical protein